MNLFTNANRHVVALVVFLISTLGLQATIHPPSSPTCSSGNFLWENPVTVNGTNVSTNLRFVDGRTTRFSIPNLPSDFSNNVTIEIAEAVSWDGYDSRDGVSQYYEQWKIVFLKNGTVVQETPYTPDIQDKVKSAEWKGSLGSSYTFPNGVDEIILAHYEDPVYGTGSAPSANSVVPTSVCFTYSVNGTSGCTPVTSNPCIRVLGTGAFNQSSKTVTASGYQASDIDKVTLELIYKGARPTSGNFQVGSDQENFSTSNVNTFDNRSSYNTEGFYRATFNNPTSNQFSYTANNEIDELVSFVAYVHLKSSECADNNTQLKTPMYDIYKETFTINYTIPSTSSDKTIELISPISELTNDSRIARVTLSAGGNSKVWTQNTFTEGNSLAYADLKLENVDGSVTSVSVTYESPSSGGDSYYNGQGVINWYEGCPPETFDFCGKKRFCTNPNQVSGSDDLNDFPIYVDYTDADLKTEANGGKVVSNDGYDIVFTNTDNELLKFKLQDYDGTTGRLKAWVRLPQVKANDSTCFFLQFGSVETTTSQESDETWSEDYRAVYHFEDYQDATSYNNNGTNNGASLNNAVLGKGVCLDGHDDYVFVGDDNSLDFGGKTITLSAWVKINTPHSNDAAIAVKGESTNQEYYMFGIDGGTTSNNLNTRVTTNNGHYRHDQGTLPDNQWALFTFVYDGNLGSDQKTTYINGVEVADQSASGNLNTGNGNLLIGKRTDGRFLEACIDELRISSAAKSADWIKTEWNNQNNPSSFYSVTEEKECDNVRETFDYCGKKRICTNPNKVSGSSELTNFPIYVDYTNVDLKTEANGGKVQSSVGNDILFTNTDNELLDFKLQEYDASTGTVKSWVRLPQVQTNDSTCFFLQFGSFDTTASRESDATWSEDYRAVYHFEDYNDATANKNDGTNNGGNLNGAVLGQGVCLDGNNDYVFVGDDNSLDLGGNTITLSAWVKINTPHPNDAAIAVKGENTNEEYYMFGIDGGTTSNNLNTRVTTNNGHYRHDQGTLPDNQWALFTFVYDGNLGSDQKTSYINGVEVADQQASGNINTGNGDLLIGKRTDGRFLEGCIDELRISSAAKSADWIKTEWNNQNDPSSFYTVTNNRTCIAVPVTLTTFTGEKVREDAVLNWTTATEVNNDRFEIERRYQGETEYTYVGTVIGNGTTTDMKNYTFVDQTNDWRSEVTYYRLKQIDFDGAFEYHGDVALTSENEVRVSIHPNPVVDKTTITLASNRANGDAQIKIFDFYGREVTSDAIINQTGAVVKLDVSTLRSGTYLVRIETGKTVVTKRLAVTR
jgi:hypothetical protein